MPALAFLPWATLDAPLRFGAFHLTPLGAALRSGVPADLAAPVRTVVAAYGFTRAVDVGSIPVLRRDDRGATDDLSDDDVADYFAFRARLAFAALASRRFFDVRYVNSDNLRLVIQGFTAERAGGALITHRRRDGAVNVLVPKGQLRERRPMHVTGWCDLERDLDAALLTALEAACGPGSEADRAAPSDLDDVVRLFVGANTDSPDVSPHTELVDLVSAFGRLVGAWDANDTVRAFLRLLPPPVLEYPSRVVRPRAADPRVGAGTAKQPTRGFWLHDAFRLRHQYGHGRVTAPAYTPVWSEREHLLLGAVALPLAVKARLRQMGLYTFTGSDDALNAAFDDLALLRPFAPAPDDDDHPESPWRAVLTEADFRPLVTAWLAEAERASAAPPVGPPAETDPAAGADARGQARKAMGGPVSGDSGTRQAEEEAPR